MSDVSASQSAPARRLVLALAQVAGRTVAYLRARAELETMDDRTLADMGASRDDIGAIARRHANAA